MSVGEAEMCWFFCIVAVFQLLSHVRLFVTPWTAAYQAPLSFTISHSLLKLMSIELVSHPTISSSVASSPSLNLSQRQGLFKWVSLMGTSTSSVRKELCRSLLGQGTVAAKTNCPSQTQALPSLADIVTGWWHPHPAFPRLYFSSSTFRWEGMVSSHQANEWKWHVMISGWKAVKRQGFLTILFFSFPLAG